MHPSRQPTMLLLAVLATLARASPAPVANPVANPVAVAVAAPEITPPPTRVLRDASKTWDRRGILDDVANDVNSVLNELGSAIPTYVAQGVPNFFQGFPTGDNVKNSLGISDAQLAALPTQVLNMPPYANWTSKGWNVLFHGNVYKQPNTSVEKLNSLVNVFLIGTDIKSLPASQQDQARNMTAEIFVVQQADQNVTMLLTPAGDSGGGGVSAGSGSKTVTLPNPTTSEGDFAVFLPIGNLSGGGLMPGNLNTTQAVQEISVHAQGATLGNATAYLVPDSGFTIISDIDDILRVTKIYQPKEGLLNSFARPFTPWLNMPQIYANWEKSIPNAHFHYLTTTPEQVSRNYMDFIYKTYPGGSFDTRPLNFSDVSATLSIRKFLLERIFQTFPKRKFILVADTSNSDIMRDYPAMATEFPGQVQCIFLRNTSATDTGDKFPYDTSGFKNLDTQSYMFFITPDDLAGLDIVGGHCLNASVAQNLTFGYQDELLGLHGSGAAATGVGVAAWAIVAAAGLWAFL